MGQARPLLALKDKALQVRAAEHILEEHLSSRQAEELVRRLLDDPAYLDARESGAEAEPEEVQEAPQDVFYQDAAGRLNEYLGTKVRIRPGRRAASRSSSTLKMTSSACLNFSPRAALIAMPIRPITSLFDLDVTVSRETSSRPHVSYKGVFNRQWTFRKSRNLP